MRAVCIAVVTVVVELQSRKRVRFQIKGDASEEEIAKIALSHSKVSGDRIVSINFDEDAPEDVTDSSAVVVEDIGASSTAPRAVAGSPLQQPVVAPAAAQRPGVGWKRTQKTADKPVAELQAEVEAIRVQQAALEESKYAGRDVDEVDDEIRALEARKTELKTYLPRKRFLYIF